MKYFLAFIHLALLFPYNSFCQKDNLQELFKLHESELENGTEQNDQEPENYQLFEALEEYSKTPLQINSSSDESLYQFPFFNEVQTKAIIRHKEIYGNLIAIEELQVVPGFDLEQLRRIKSLITVGATAGQKKITPGTIFSDGNNTIMIRIQKNPGGNSQNDDFPGSDEKLYFRYKYQLADRIKIGLTAEKDPGEELLGRSGSPGFDFYSGHIIIKSKSFIRQVCLGDFGIQHGQGLVLSSGLGFGKSSNVLNILKNSGGIRPYSSVDENNFLRGIAINLNLRNWDSNLFFSSHKKDADIKSDNDGVEYFSSFQSSGYHRTDSELEDKKSINECIAGITISRTLNRLNIGGIFYSTQFSKKLYKETNSYNQFDFNGDKNLNFGINASYLYKNIHWFSEIAMSKNGGLAYLIGSIIHLHPKLSYSVLARNYQKDYHALQASGFSENTKTANEKALFSSLELKLSQQLTLSAYSDFFAFPWLKFGVDAPSSGYDYLIQLKWKPKRTFESYIQLKHKSKEENSSDSEYNTHHPEQVSRYSMRWNLRVKLNETWDWGSRIEKSIYQKGSQRAQEGLLIYQDIIFHPLDFPVSIGLRFSIFDTDDYNSRIYAYENDVLFSYSIPALQGRGEKIYLNVRYRISRSIDLWIRYAITQYEKELPDNENPDGQKDSKKELKAQIRLQF